MITPFYIVIMILCFPLLVAASVCIAILLSNIMNPSSLAEHPPYLPVPTQNKKPVKKRTH